MRHDPSQGCYEEKIIQAQIGTTKDIFFEREMLTKMASLHFKHKQLEPINFVPVQCNDLELLHKDLYFYESMTSKSN
jgi:hypothetical protein